MSSPAHNYHRLDDNNNSSYDDDDEHDMGSNILSVGAPNSGDVELQRISTKSVNGTNYKTPRRKDTDDSFTDNDDEHNDNSMNPLTGSGGSSSKLRRSHNHPQVYPQRWIQLFYLSTLALISDWVCFSTASIPDIFELAYPGRTSEGIIDKFLLMNVVSCLCVTDTVNKYNLQKCTKISSLVMCIGCWLRSGFGIVTVLFDIFGMREEYKHSILSIELIDGVPLFGLPPFPILVIGTLMVGAAQPFFQCTPPLLSAQWFASNERATSSAIALNFNQVGIAAAFVVGGMMVDESSSDNEGDYGERHGGSNSVSQNLGLIRYFALIAVISTVVCIGTFKQFDDLPPVPPSASEMEKHMQQDQGHNAHREPPFQVSVRKFFNTPGFVRPLVAFIYSIAITNVVGAFIDEVSVTFSLLLDVPILCLLCTELSYLMHLFRQQVMERGGVTDRRAIAWAGCGFEFAIVLGGVILGRYVDRTKKYKVRAH